MNFDFGEVFTRAWQITWKNKVLWVLTVLPFLISFLIFPIWLILVFTQDMDPERIAQFMSHPLAIVLLSIFYIVIFIVSMTLQIVSRASVTLGIYRAEENQQPITFIDLLKDGLPYFWRILGITLLVTAGMTVVFLAFFLITGLLSVVTLGLATICLQPLFLLMFPLMILVMAFMEQAEAAVIADGMGILDSAKQAYELIKSHIWKYVLISFVIYFVMNILVSILIFPFMIPMFFMVMNTVESGADMGNIFKIQAVFMAVMMPLMALIQSVSLTYMKSAMMVTYLRLTRSSTSLNTAVVAEANA